jgi:4-carboxymuconolactone decarboxylase
VGEERVGEAERRALLAVAAALGTRDAARIAGALCEAVVQASATAVEEVFLQSHLFIGYPDALNALAEWRRLSGSVAPRASADDPAGWRQRGEEVCARVYGANYLPLRANVRALHPDFEAWMLEVGYGRVIGRGGLELALRELCIATLLAVWNVPRQLHSHLRGALNAGASVAEVDEAMEVACAVAPQAEAVRRLWGEVRGRALAGAAAG